ncbi:MAG: 3-isopropylmalate dehydrogenase [Bacteroidetes bacterium]|nr:3-isopropylmalate dehydrogenase [Bacteroidota bacterium]
MRKNIAVLSGDGIGPEVIEQAIKILDAIGERFDHSFEYHYGDVGAIAIEKTGDPLPEETIQISLDADAVLFGAIGHPKYDNDPTAKVRPEHGLLRIRKTLGLYANIRPVKAYPSLIHLSPLRKEKVEDTDFIIYRELTSGIYFGERGRNKEGTMAYDQCVYNTFEIERIAHLAFKHALHRKKKLTLVDKSNVLETSRLWRETVTKIAVSYPDVEFNSMYVDNAAMQLILYPNQFDIILTTNMFGDIISDEGSVITGSLGLLPSASVGERTSLFEPIHGSFPQAAGKDLANPMAAILSAAMMLDSFDMFTEAEAIRYAVLHTLEEDIGTPELEPTVAYSCSQIGDFIASVVNEMEDFQVDMKKINDGISTII